jgi:broad specificity phosphatase PhoE
MWFEDGQDLDWSHFFTHRNELGGENFADIQRRVVAFFNDLITTPHHNVVVCSHGDPLYLLFLHLKKLPLPNELTVATEDDGYQPKASIRCLTLQNQDSYTFSELLKI